MSPLPARASTPECNRSSVRDVPDSIGDELAVLLDEARRTATRLWLRLALPAADLDDLRQDLLLDLIRRLPAFDPRRGSLGAFAGRILRNQASRIAVRVARERQARGGALLSLDQPLQDGQTIGDTIDESSGLSAWHGQKTTAEPGVDLRVDVARMLGSLSPEDRALCAAVALRPVRVLVEERFGSRSQIYRRLSDLRYAVIAHGLGPSGTICETAE